MTQTQIEQTSKEQAIAKQATPVKTYVLDTTVLINNPDIVSRLKGKVVIPLAVIGQLDGLKNNEDIVVAQRARQASRAILEAQTKGKVEIMNNFKKGIKTLDSEADNKIIGTCLTLKEQGEDVNLLTTDVNMRITARSMGVGTKEIEGRRRRKAKVWSIITLCLFSLAMILMIVNACKMGTPNYKTPREIIFCIVIFFIMSFASAGFVEHYVKRKYNSFCSDEIKDNRMKWELIDDPAFADCSFSIWYKNKK